MPLRVACTAMIRLRVVRVVSWSSGQASQVMYSKQRQVAEGKEEKERVRGRGRNNVGTSGRPQCGRRLDSAALNRKAGATTSGQGRRRFDLVVAFDVDNNRNNAREGRRNRLSTYRRRSVCGAGDSLLPPVRLCSMGRRHGRVPRCFVLLG